MTKEPTAGTKPISPTKSSIYIKSIKVLSCKSKNVISEQKILVLKTKALLPYYTGKVKCRK